MRERIGRAALFLALNCVWIGLALGAVMLDGGVP